jgi:hypothetical protein
MRAMGKKRQMVGKVLYLLMASALVLALVPAMAIAQTSAALSGAREEKR